MSQLKQFELFINGTFVPAASGETFESINPFNGERIAHFARGAQADIDKAVQAARNAFDHGPWTTMPGSERAQYLNRLAEKINECSKELVSYEVQDAGSTVRKAKSDVWLSAKQLGYFASFADSDWMEPLDALSQPGTSKNFILREPIGVCGQIIPWNFPLMMAIWKLGPALAAGNTVVLKPAEDTPLSAMRLAELIAEVGFPPGVVNIVTGYGKEAGEPLAKHPLVDKVAFTGSTEVGRHMMHCAADTMKKVTLECGGKSANIVLDDADLEMAIDGSLFAAFYHGGQCCTAGTRLFLQDRLYEKFVSGLLERVKSMKLGDPASPETDMGPLVSKKQQERVLSYIEAGKASGARCLTGGNKPSDPALAKGFFVEPTLFADVDITSKIAQEEIFGPVVSIFSFKTLDDVVQLANNSIYGLSAAVWSKDDEKALQVAKKLRAGTVWINDYHLISEKAPFGGYKQSGLGRELGVEGLKEYTEIKHVHLDEIKDRQKKFWYNAVLAPKTPVNAG